MKSTTQKQTGPSTGARCGPGTRVTERDSDLSALAGLADASPDVTRINALQRCADGARPIQRVKNELIGPDAFTGNMSFALIHEFGKERKTTSPEAILAVARSKYEANRDRGTTLMNEINALKTEKDDDFGRSADEIAVAREEKSLDSERKHELLYETVASPQERKGHYATSTRGAGAEQYAYTNNIDVSARSIETNSNFADKDPNRARGDYLNNSEIFWHQWKAAVHADTQKGSFKERRRKKKTKKLGQINRKEIMNPDTLFTVHFALPDGMYFMSGTSYQFGPDQEEFAALLGTPNGRGVAYLLKDHYHEMNRQSFGPVDVNGDTTSLTFKFV